MSILILRRTAVEQPITALATAAASLGAGQSLKFATIAEAIIEPDGADFLKYGSSGVWDPVRKQARWIGRRESNDFRYRGLAYDEADDEFSNFALWTTDTYTNGHGYDHNAINPANGHHYFRVYGSGEVYEEDGAGNWSTLAALPGASIAGGLSYTPLGLIYNDRNTLKVLEGGSWREIADFNEDANVYHAVSQYNPISELLVFGAGNLDKAMRSMGLDETIASIPTPTIELGSGEDQGVFTADPGGPGFIGWQKATDSWEYWEPDDIAWSALTQSSGDGSSPQNGTPNLDTSAGGRPTIAIPISTHNVVMYIQSNGSGADVWLYKKTASPS
jgi:hypothetical protein